MIDCRAIKPVGQPPWRTLATLLGTLVAVASGAGPPAELPAFTHARNVEWLNSAPLQAAALRGRPVLVEFWAFECSNCLASLPWVHHVRERYGAQLAIVAVHSPEFPEERDPAAVARAIQRLGIDYPVMLDADYSYWRRLDNHYWPAFYLYGADGRLVGQQVGEMHAGETRSDAFEQLIVRQLPAHGR